MVGVESFHIYENQFSYRRKMNKEKLKTAKKSGVSI
jgi:hypothetical protein